MFMGGGKWSLNVVVTFQGGQLLLVHQQQMLAQQRRSTSVCHNNGFISTRCLRLAIAPRRVRVRVGVSNSIIVAPQQAYCRPIQQLQPVWLQPVCHLKHVLLVRDL